MKHLAASRAIWDSPTKLEQNEASRFRSEGNHLYYSPKAGTKSPEIGDLRIYFEHVPNGPVSLMAALSGNTFASYSTRNGEPIDRLYPGILTAEQLIEKLKSENIMIAWLLRGLGFILCLIGMLMIFSPAQALFKWIPLVGDIAGGLLFVVSGLVAVTLSMVTIAVSWIAVRPILAISLLAIAGGAIYLLLRTNRRVHHPQEPLMLTDDMMVS
jgi:Transmembrane protein 43